jgi:ABC-2 type transport system ATP-binding protein
VLATVGGTARDGMLVRVNVPGGAGPKSMLEAVRLLDREELDPATMVLREPTLDDVFLELTGHTTSDGEETDEGENS